MRTRSSDSRERRRALAALSGIAGRLAEDYLLLLPEALPFLAELLEDPDPPTQAAAQALVQQLQDTSGESLQVKHCRCCRSRASLLLPVWQLHPET